MRGSEVLISPTSLHGPLTRKREGQKWGAWLWLQFLAASLGLHLCPGATEQTWSVK